jgi:hypothetical protein
MLGEKKNISTCHQITLVFLSNFYIYLNETINKISLCIFSYDSLLYMEFEGVSQTRRRTKIDENKTQRTEPRNNCLLISQ